MIIETDRLRLRSAEPQDIEAFVGALNDWEVQQWLTQPPFPYLHKDGEAYVAIVQANHATSHPTIFVIADKGSGATVGAASVDIGAEGVGELGYWFAREDWGRGFGQEAVGALLRHAKAHPDLRRLVAVTDPENLRSQRVLIASGFVDCGLRDRPLPSRRGSTRVRGFELPIEKP